MKQLINTFKKHLSIYEIPITAFLAIVVMFSTYYIKYRNVELGYKILFETIICFIIFSVFVVYIRYTLEKMLAKEYKSSLLTDNKYLTLKLSLMILICWIPLLFAFYPGTAINDTWGQLKQILTNTWNSQHPLLCTWIFKILLVPISIKTNQWHYAMFLYVLIQAACTSTTFAYTICYAKNKLKISDNILLLCLGIYCFLPIFPLSVQTIGKDSLSAWLYVLFIVKVVEIVRSRGESLKSKKELFFNTIIAILCVLTKKVEFYIILFAMISIFFSFKQCRRQTTIIIIVLLIITNGVLPYINNKFDIKKGGLQEMFSMLFQQSARYVKFYSNEVTQEEKETINKVLDYSNLAAKYNPINADPVKAYYQRGENIDYFKYLLTWGKMFFKHPMVYLEASSKMLAGWFSFYKYEPLNDMDWHNQLNPKLIPVWVATRPEMFQKMANIYNNIYNIVYKIPIINIIFTYAFYATLIPSFLLISFIKNYNKYKCNKRYSNLIPISVMFLSLVLGCWLAPVSVFLEGMRYLYPITYSFIITTLWYVYLVKVSKERRLIIQKNI